MSVSGEEERLSTPTEVSFEEDDNTNKEDQVDEKEPKSPTKNNTSRTKSNKRMTLSNTPPGNDHNHDNINLEQQDPKLPRRFAQMHEENVLLKKQLRKQEDRIKVLATKLIRLISERSSKTKREEILLEEQKARIVDLEHEVSNLREKLLVSKQQLSSYTRLIPHHHHSHQTPSRQTSVLSSSSGTKHKKTRSASGVGGGSTSNHPPRPSTASGAASRGNLLNDKNFADRVEELLLEAKAENQALEDQLKHCRQRLEASEEELEKVKESLQRKEAEHQEELVSIKSQVGKEQDIAKKKKQLSDNIQLIRLQRDSRRTASWLSTLEAQCRALEVSLANVTENAQQLETQLSETQEELGEEQQKNITLQKQLEDAINSLSRLKELEAQITALQEENRILKDSNESLLKKAFSVTEKAEKAESLERSMKVQIGHLENCLKSELTTKNELQQSLRIEKEKYVRLEFTNEKLQQTIENLNEEMKKFRFSSEAQQTSAEVTDKGSCDNDTSEQEVAQKKVAELERELYIRKKELNSLADEHGKMKALLKAQTTSNREYQREVEQLTMKLDKADEFHHKKLQDFVKVLEERTKQISHLEKWMDDWKVKNSQASLQNKQSHEPCKICGHCPAPEEKGKTDNAKPSTSTQGRHEGDTPDPIRMETIFDSSDHFQEQGNDDDEEIGDEDEDDDANTHF